MAGVDAEHIRLRDPEQIDNDEPGWQADALERGLEALDHRAARLAGRSQRPTNARLYQSR